MGAEPEIEKQTSLGQMPMPPCAPCSTAVQSPLALKTNNHPLARSPPFYRSVPNCPYIMPDSWISMKVMFYLLFPEFQFHLDCVREHWANLKLLFLCQSPTRSASPSLKNWNGVQQSRRCRWVVVEESRKAVWTKKQKKAKQKNKTIILNFEQNKQFFRRAFCRKNKAFSSII